MQHIKNILNGEDSNCRDINIHRIEDKKERKVKDLTIKPIFDLKDDYFDPPHPRLLRGPFSLLEIAPKGSGKTVLLQNLMLWYYPFFDQIFIWSPTINIDRKWRLLIEKLDIEEDNLFTDYNESDVTMIMNKIMDFNTGKDGKDKVRVLFIFDDIVEQLPKGMKESALNKLSMNHRHYNISHIIISQSFKKLDPVVRLNTTGIILFNTDNSAERMKIIEELCGNYGKKRFEELYIDCIRKKYSFMFINYDTRKVYKKFDKQVGDMDIEPLRLFNHPKYKQIIENGK